MVMVEPPCGTRPGRRSAKARIMPRGRDAPVLEELVVLDGDDRVLHVHGDLGKRQQGPLLDRKLGNYLVIDVVNVSGERRSVFVELVDGRDIRQDAAHHDGKRLRSPRRQTVAVTDTALSASSRAERPSRCSRDLRINSIARFPQLYQMPAAAGIKRARDLVLAA